jgi:MFS transporter, DHA1 family, tetracycline resistance protein
MASKKNAAIIFIFITLLIDVIGFGIIIPVLPKLIAQLKGIEVNEASKYGGYLLFSFAIAQFLFSSLIGSLSDKYGRRPILLISLFGFGIDYIILALAPTYGWLLIGRVIAGITGASFTTAAAYIADISTDEDRTKNFGMIGAAFGIGFIIGPLLGGLLGSIGLRIPFYGAAILSLLNFLYGYFILPESLPKEKRRNFDWYKANPINTITKLSNYKSIGWFLVAFFLLNIGSHAVQSNWGYFTMYRFNWNEAMVGYSLAAVGILVALVQAVFAQRSAKIFGENKTIIIGFGLYTFGMFLFSIAPSSIWMFIFLIPYCMGGIAMPNLQSLMVKSVPSSEQGELQGGLTSLMSVTTIIGPLMMTSVFYYFTHKGAIIFFPGASFFLGGLFMLASFIICFLLLTSRPSNDVKVFNHKSPNN